MLTENIEELATSYGLSVRLRTHELNAWTDTLGSCHYVPVMYTNASIEFQLACQRSNDGEGKDLSLLIYWDKKPTAVWPINLADKKVDVTPNSCILTMLPPIFSSNCPASSSKQITKKCLDLAKAIASSIGVDSWESAESFDDTNGLSNWHAESMARGSVCSVRHDLFLDLRLDMVEIKRNFRKSYKALITSGQRLWEICVLDSGDESVWNEFYQLHVDASGRKTRSDETWALHLQDIATQQAFLVYQRNSAGEMVGGGFFNYTRNEGLYAVGAYDRSLFDKPLGHVVQYRAIEEFKKRGVRWYKLGLRPHRSETPAPTDKQVSIGDFKRGFASHLFPIYILLHSATEAIVLNNEEQ